MPSSCRCRPILALLILGQDSMSRTCRSPFQSFCHPWFGLNAKLCPPSSSSAGMRIKFCFRNCNIVSSCPATQGGSIYWPRDSSVRDPLGRLFLKKCSRVVWVQARRGAALRELESTLNEAETEPSIPVGEILSYFCRVLTVDSSQSLLYQLSIIQPVPNTSHLVMSSWCSAVKELHWHSPLQIIRYPDPRLRAANARIGVFDESLEKLGRELLDTMYKAYVLHLTNGPPIQGAGLILGSIHLD